VSAEETAEFVRVWQSSASAKEAAERLGLPRQRARDVASYLRGRRGVPLKRFSTRSLRAEDLAGLRELAAETYDCTGTADDPDLYLCDCGKPREPRRVECEECRKLNSSTAAWRGR
jgi:hypothetical protein